MAPPPDTQTQKDEDEEPLNMNGMSEDEVQEEVEEEEEDDDDEEEEVEEAAVENGPRLVALPRPAYTTATLHDLYRLEELIKEGYIDLNAEYQRGEVWTVKKQEKLIDSLHKNIYLPPLLFSCAMETDGAETRVCMDGKQRLTSIGKGLVVQKSSKESDGGRWYYKKKKGEIRKITIMPEKYRRQFMLKSVPIVEYYELTPADEREIFSRVQLGVPLSAAEKLAVASGAYADFMKQEILPRCCEAKDALDGRVARLPRGKLLQILGHFLLLLTKDESLGQINQTTTSVMGFLNSDEEPTNKIKKRAVRIVDRFLGLTLIPPDDDIEPRPLSQISALRAKPKPGMSPTHQVFTSYGMMGPVEIVWTLLFIQKFWKLEDGQMLEGIEMLRFEAKEAFQAELKNNKRVGLFFKDFMTNFGVDSITGKYGHIKGNCGESETSGKFRNSVSSATPPVVSSSSRSQQSTSRTKATASRGRPSAGRGGGSAGATPKSASRKRPGGLQLDGDYVDDVDYRPSSSSKRGRGAKTGGSPAKRQRTSRTSNGNGGGPSDTPGWEAVDGGGT